MTNAETNETAGRREWIGLAVLVLPALLVSMDLTVLHLALPSISAELEPGSAEQLWIVDIYGFMLAGLLIPMGVLGDRIGRRRLLLLGGGAFAVASTLAAFADSAGMLIATRALLGVAGATLMPSTLALIRNMFADPRQRSVAVSVWMMGFMVGGAIGPLAGGALLELADWRAVFLLPVPVMVALVVLGPVLLPEHRDPAPGRFDLAGAALSLVAVLSTIQAVKHAAENGVDATVAVFAAVGLAVGAAFVRRQRRVRDPLVDLALFRRRTFTGALVTNTGGVLVMMGSFLFVAQYLQLVRGLEPIEAGLWLLPQTAGFLVGSTAAPALAQRLRPATVLAAGMVLASAGFVVLAVADGLAGVVAGTVVIGLGLAPAFALGTDLILSAAPPERAGAASAISETGSELGGALGIALLGSIGAAVYRAELPGGLPEVARDTLGGAVGADLPAPVLEAAQAAFMAGFETVAIVAAAIAVVLAVLVTVVLREAPRPAPVPVPA